MGTTKKSGGQLKKQNDNMISVFNVVVYLLKKQKYTLMYLFLKKMLGPSWVHPCYSRPPLHTRLLTWVKTRGSKDYFFDAWEQV